MNGRLRGLPVDSAPSVAMSHAGKQPSAGFAAAPQSKIVICTLGMHRSGTSLVSRILNLLGVYLGAPHDLSNSGADNPKGYWEHYPIALLNDELLARLGGRWDEPPAFPEAWPLDPNLADLRLRARAVVSEAFSAAPVWGWKDPRTCLTLPFWQDVIGSIRYVICVRNPGAVVASLNRRDGMSGEKAERLWLTHVQSSLAHTSGQPRLFVFYDDIMHDWAPEVRRIAAFIGCPDRADAPDVREGVDAFLERELYHHRVTSEELAANQQISFATTGLYLALRSQSPGAPANDALELNEQSRTRHKTLDLIGSRALQTWIEHAALVTERQRLVEENQVQSIGIGALTAERDRLIAEVDALEERAMALSAECQAHAVRERQLVQALASVESGLSRVTHERDAHARDREKAQEELREIHGSCAWRLVTAARRAIVHLFPAGTTRRRSFESVLRFVTRHSDVGLRT